MSDCTITKQCTKCKEVKNVTEFHRNRAHKDGRTSQCKVCKTSPESKVQHQIWLSKNRAKHNENQRRRYQKHRDVLLLNLREKYCSDSEFRKLCSLRRKAKNVGLSVVEYLRKWDELLDLQDGCCALCSIHNSQKQLVMDHNHFDMSIRGLLCDKCNTALGLFGDDPIRLGRAIDYLK